MTGVYTNTTFVDAYRGAGRPEATYVIERAMDLFAAEIGMDRAELRRRNFIQPDEFPYENPSGLYTASGGAKIAIDSGDYEPAMDMALATAGYPDLAGKKAEAKARGKLLGLGFSTYIEVCGVAPSKWIGAVGEGWGAAMWESSNIKVHLTGKVVVTVGTSPQGQGHETTYAQVIASELGIPMEDVVIQHSDTQGTPFGYGTYGSRTSSVGMTAAIKAADKIKDKARRYAAHMLEASPGDIEIEGAEYRVKGSPDRKKTFQEIAFALDLAFDAPEGMEPYLDETAYYDTPNATTTTTNAPVSSAHQGLHQRSPTTPTTVTTPLHRPPDRQPPKDARHPRLPSTHPQQRPETHQPRQADPRREQTPQPESHRSLCLPRASKPPLRQRNSPQLSKAPSPHNIDTTARPGENQHPNTRTQPVGTDQNSLDPTDRLAPRQHTLFAHSKAPDANGYTI